ncbi:3-hydroxybutyryl-CoA dehydratase [Synergistales bacterium]|nr:3-hydroxybutyryl-CoA dehydratase [Synergistales bacterium]
MKGILYTFDELSVGMSASLSRTVTRDDIARFAEVTGDRNPIHIDEEFAREFSIGRKPLGRNIAHGILGAGMLSAVLGTKLPGPGNVYMDQTLSFKKPVFIGDTITANVEITDLRPEKYHVRLSTVCVNQDEVVVIDGEALLYFKILNK